MHRTENDAEKEWIKDELELLSEERKYRQQVLEELRSEYKKVKTTYHEKWRSLIDAGKWDVLLN